MNTAHNYPEVGAVTRPGPLPAGYNHLHHRALIGHGREVLEAAGEAVTTFRMHREAGVHVETDGARAEVGLPVRCAIGVGPLRVGAPCRVVWTAYESDRIGFSYGTLAGHPECGEEVFQVELAPDGKVWFTVTAFSRPGRWYTRLAGPLVPFLQHQYARHCGRTLRRLAAAR
ncbi:DUF1990 family protein [Kitasatospora sp. NPDC048365]|uniref:DUF1990 family protein n=1 Tax=Kitasatospora sp. NPDC048365 TaxID=3364050 RepID=UPI00372197C4